MWHSRCSVSSLLSFYTLTPSQCDIAAARPLHFYFFFTFTEHVLRYLYFFHLLCSNAHVLRTLPKNLHLISMHNVLRLNTYTCIIPCFWKSKLPMIDKWPPILNQLAIRDQVTTYPSHPLQNPNTDILSSSSLISIAYVYLPLVADTWYQYRFNSTLWFWIFSVPLRQPFN